MRIISKQFFLGSTVLLLAFGMNAAADDRYYGNERGGWERGGGQVRGNEPVRRALFDLDRLRSIRYADGHERKHIDNARRDLLRFEESWSRGKFDRDRLDGAIGNLDHLANSGQVHPREREVLYQDVRALREFRAYRGNVGYRGYRP
jgi:hypothetical protein